MRFISSLIAIALLAGCAGENGPGTIEPRRAQLAEVESRHAVLFTPGSEEVMEAEREALNRFLYPLLGDDPTEVLVEAPGAGTDMLARNRSLAVVAMLSERQISSTMVPLNEYTPGQVRVIVRRQTAYVPGCPDWSSEEGSPFVNGVSSNYGCATEQNLSVMIDNPADLARGRSSMTNTGNSAGDAVNRLRSGNVQPLQENSGSDE